MEISDLPFPMDKREKVKIPIGSQIKRAGKLVVPSLVTAVSVLVLVLVDLPKFNDVLSLRSVNKELTARALALEDKRTKLAQFEGNRAELEKQLGYSEKIMPSSKEVFPLVVQIENAAIASGVSLSKVDVSPGTVDEVGGRPSQGTVTITTPPAQSGARTPAEEAAIGTSSVEVRVSVSSDYKSLIQFINNIMSTSRVLVVKSLTISTASGEEGGLVRSFLTIDAYWLPLPSELGPLEASIEELTPSELERLAAVRDSLLQGTPTVPTVPVGRQDLFVPF